MAELNFLSTLAQVEGILDPAQVEGILDPAQRQIDAAKAAGLSATAIDASGLSVEAIDALARALAGRGYRVAKTVGVTEYRHCYPLLRVSW